MGRVVDSNQERSKADKARLDSQGRPVAVRDFEHEGEGEAEQGKRVDGKSAVRVAVRLGVLLCAISTQQGCRQEPAPVNPRLEEILAETISAAGRSKRWAKQSTISSKLASESARQCGEILKLEEGR